MCGICGKLMFDSEAKVSPTLVKAMADTIHHRGPDDEGYYVSGPIGLGFRRLSIIDLQERPSAPLERGRDDLDRFQRRNLQLSRNCAHSLLSKGHVFKTQTDTEVIVHLYEETWARMPGKAARNVCLRHMG